MSSCLDEGHDNVEKKKVDKIFGQLHRISERITGNHGQAWYCNQQASRMFLCLPSLGCYSDNVH
jgi:hypothetical protein